MAHMEHMETSPRSDMTWFHSSGEICQIWEATLKQPYQWDQLWDCYHFTTPAWVEPSTASNSNHHNHPLQNRGLSHVYIKSCHTVIRDTVNKALTYPNHVKHLPSWLRKWYYLGRDLLIISWFHGESRTTMLLVGYHVGYPTLPTASCTCTCRRTSSRTMQNSWSRGILQHHSGWFWVWANKRSKFCKHKVSVPLCCSFFKFGVEFWAGFWMILKSQAPGRCSSSLRAAISCSRSFPLAKLITWRSGTWDQDYVDGGTQGFKDIAYWCILTHWPCYTCTKGVKQGPSHPEEKRMASCAPVSGDTLSVNSRNFAVTSWIWTGATLAEALPHVTIIPLYWVSFHQKHSHMFGETL